MSIKTILKGLIQKQNKRILWKKNSILHKRLINNILNKEQIKVIFLVLQRSTWKLDLVYECMKQDKVFKPIILVCPIVNSNFEMMIKEMKDTLLFFKNKNFEVISALDDSNKWINLEDLKPDVVFFTNSHDITKKQYYEDVYKNYLTCYIPYFYAVTTKPNDILSYDQDFHNSVWKIFTSNKFSQKNSIMKSTNHGINCVLSGYPVCEELLKNSQAASVWKKQPLTKKKIIWAPHHTIGKSELQISNFLRYAFFFKKMANKYSQEVQWSFKPHPLLKQKLYILSGWGKYLTDEYYSFWKESDNSQLDEGEYIDLFKQTDALIHDSGSFLSEFLFVKKPALYLMPPKNSMTLFNSFGEEMLKAYYIANSENDIEQFIKNIINESINIKNVHEQILNQEISFLGATYSPSSIIVNIIKNELLNK